MAHVRTARWPVTAFAFALTLVGGLSSPWLLMTQAHAESSGLGEPPRGKVVFDHQPWQPPSADLPPGISRGSVGTMAGAVSVGASGGVGWSTGLKVVPGVGGMEPSLSISYGGSGYGGLGVGFSLGGESSVSRCRQTQGQDGRDAPITWTQTDALCLDGTRLVPVEGALGDAGTEYRLQTSPNVRVVGLGSSTSPYSGFAVYTPDGRQTMYGVQQPHQWTHEAMQYGQLDGARVPLSWHIARVLDTRSGNEMRYRYAGEPVAGEGKITPSDFRMVEIQYGINDKAGAAVSRRVMFEYSPAQKLLGKREKWEDKAWVHEGYVAGQHYVRWDVLSVVRMQMAVDAEWQTVHYYKLGYEAVPQLQTKLEPEVEVEPVGDPSAPPVISTSDRLRLRALQECGSHSNSGDCFWPTLFEWSGQADAMTPMPGFGWDGVPFYPQPPSSELETSSYFRIAEQVTGDFDGDGDVDMLVMPELVNEEHIWGDYNWSKNRWELWETDAAVHGPQTTDVKAWSAEEWTSRAGTVVPAFGAIQLLPYPEADVVSRPPDAVQTGHRKDKQAPPIAWAANYDGTGGTDVLVGEPVLELAGSFLDVPWGVGSKTSAYRRYANEDDAAIQECGLKKKWDVLMNFVDFNACWPDLLQSEADYTGHPGFMRDLKILRKTPANGSTQPSAKFDEISLNYQDGRPILWAQPLDLNGDALTDVMFCKADEDYAAVAGQALPMFYGADPAFPAKNWVSGTMQYALNVPGAGIDLSQGGTPASNGGVSAEGVVCHAKDNYLVMDVYGDGRESLLHRAHPHARHKTIKGLEPAVPCCTVDDPYPYDENASELTGYFHKVWEKVNAEKLLGEEFYSAFTYTMGEGMHHGATTLPLEQFMLWQQKGNIQGRYSTHQAASDADADGGLAPSDTRNGRLTDWGDPNRPMVSGGPSDMRIGDVNGDGLDDVLMVDMDECFYQRKTLAEDDAPKFEGRECSFQDAYEFGLSLVEQTYEKLAVAIYLNRGDGTFALGSMNQLWDTDLSDDQKDVLELGKVPGKPNLDSQAISKIRDAAWTIATRATRSWRAEFNSSIMGDANGDGLADLGYLSLALMPTGGWDGDSMSGLYRMRPVWRLARHGGRLASNKTPMGLWIGDLVPASVPGGWQSWECMVVEYLDIEWDPNDAATFSPCEQRAYGLSARLMQIDVDRDGQPEMAFYDHVRGQYKLARMTGMDEPQAHLLTAVTDGLGARTEVDYAPQWMLTEPATPWSEADIALPYPLWQRPSTAAAAMELRTDTGQDDGDAPRYNATHYLYGKSRMDVRLGISLGIERSTVESAATLPNGLVNRRVTTRYDVDPVYDLAFKAYPLAGSVLSTTALSWGTADATASLSHSAQRSSAHAGLKPGTWWRRVDTANASSYEAGEELAPAERAAFMACLVEANDGPADCTLGAQPSYEPLTHAKTINTYDNDGYGLLRTQIVESAGATTVSESAFEHRDPAQLPGTYLLGLPTRSTVAHEPRAGAGFTLRIGQNTYDAAGRLASSTVEPERPEYRSTVAYTYDDFGHVLTETLSATGIAAATTTYGYSASGAYQTSVTNALGQTASTRWYEGCGIPEHSTNPLGQTQVSDRDVFCRVRGSQAFFGDVPLNRKTQILFEEWKPDENEPYPDHEVLVTTQVEGGAKSTTLANRVGQVLVSQGPGFGFDAYTQTTYDVLGRAIAVSMPTKVGDQPKGWTTTAYDGQNRVVGVTKPDGTTQSTRYARYLTEATNELGHVGRSEMNAQGQVVRVMPPLDPERPEQDTSMQYTYGAFGTLIEAAPYTPTAVKGATQLRYDDYGRMVESRDAQAGSRFTRYDALGRVDQTEDMLGQITQHRYDVLGRLVERTEAFGTPEAKTALWTYDLVAPGVLTQATNADGTATEEPLLDEYFRGVGSRSTIHGRSFEQRQSFDAWGRPASVSYPSLSLLAPVTVWTKYNDLDQPIEQSVNGQTLWEPVAADVWGMTEQRYGAGVLSAHATHDPLTGRLQEARTERHVTLDNVSQSYTLEHFTYDWYDHGLIRQRTQKALLQTQADQVDQFRYSPRGELASWSTLGKNGVMKHGSLATDGFGNITHSPTGEHTYFAEKLLTIKGPLGNFGYTYTDNGQVLTRTHIGGETTLSYDAMGRVNQIDAPGTSQRITYNADGLKVHTLDKATGRETFYLGGYQEERGGELAAKGAVIGRYALGVAHLTRTWTAANLAYSDDLHYTPPADHLGSTTLVTDATGAIKDRRAYDTWGNERDPDDWTAFKAAPKDDVLTPASGYTGHHERKQYGATAPGISALIDMQTRYYDPAAMQFLQPDSIVPDAFNPLSWNRRTYVDNSPVNFSDPTGMAKSAEASIADAAEEIDGENYSNSKGMSFGNGGPVNAPTGIVAGNILAGMRAGRDRMATIIRGSFRGALPLDKKAVEDMTSEEKFWLQAYQRDAKNYGLAGMEAPFSNVDEYVNWRLSSRQAQAMGMNSQYMEDMAIASDTAAGVVGFGGITPKSLGAGKISASSPRAGIFGMWRVGGSWRWAWQKQAPRNAKNIVANAKENNTLHIVKEHDGIVSAVLGPEIHLSANGRRVADIWESDNVVAVMFTDSRFASVANARAALDKIDGAYPGHASYQVDFSFTSPAGAQSFARTVQSQGGRFANGRPYIVEVNEQAVGEHVVSILTQGASQTRN